MNISTQEIEHLADKVVSLAMAGATQAASQELKPILDIKCPFSKLDRLGREIGKASSDFGTLIEVFDKIINHNAMGGFVIVGQALIWFLPSYLNEVIEKSREYIIKGNAWYVCDIIGERSLGHALVNHFDRTLPWLETLLKDDNTWVKRSVGGAIHFFSKRVLDQPEKTKKLLQMVEPHLEEKQIDFVKGIGWGLKTIGRHHPDILVQFLKSQIEKKDVSKTLVRKAVTYLEDEKKAELLHTL